MCSFIDIPITLLPNILKYSHAAMSDNIKYSDIKFNVINLNTKIYFIECVLQNMATEAIKSFHDLEIIRKSLYLFYNELLKDEGYQWGYIISMYKKYLSPGAINKRRFIDTYDILTHKYSSDYVNINKYNPIYYKKNSTMRTIWEYIINNCVSSHTFTHYSNISNLFNHDIIMNCFNTVPKKTWLNESNDYLKNNVSRWIDKLLIFIINNTIKVTVNDNTLYYILEQ